LRVDCSLRLVRREDLRRARSVFVVIREAAINMLHSDPAGAFALRDQVAVEEHPNFLGSLYANWGAEGH
jgi:hypothetical protein